MAAVMANPPPQSSTPVASGSSARNSPASISAEFGSRDGSNSDASTSIHPSTSSHPPSALPPLAPSAPSSTGKGKSGKRMKGGGAGGGGGNNRVPMSGNISSGTNSGTGNDSADAHKALLSKISQLEASSTENAHEAAEIEAEVKKANRDLSQLLNTMEPQHSKLDTVQRKYTELLSEMKKVEREHVKAKKRGDQLQKEKEELGKERTRERGLKEKLEKLSRELTRENKKLKEDLRDLKESATDRNDELHRKLEAMVFDVDEVVTDRRGPERHSLDLEQDKLFREKFTSFLHQYELRELLFQSLLRTKDLEIAYQIARHDQLKKVQESELSKSHQLTRQVSTFSQTENELRGQLNVYVEKFKQVEDTLNNSNDLFLTFRKEMEEMSKKTKRLEKENLNLVRKHEATNKSILQLAEERTRYRNSLNRLSRQNDKLTHLCRAMQTGGYGGSNSASTVEGSAGSGALPEPSVSSAGGGDAPHHNHHHHHHHDGEYEDGLGGESDSEGEEYEDDEYDEEEDEDDEDDDTEEEGVAPVDALPRPYGPPPPPPSTTTTGAAGAAADATESSSLSSEMANGRAKAPLVNGRGARE